MSILEFESGPLGYLGTGWASPGVYQLRLQGTEANLFYDLDFNNWDESHLVDAKSTLVSQAYRESVTASRRHASHRHVPGATRRVRPRHQRVRPRSRWVPSEAIRALAVVHAALESSKRNGEAVPVSPMVERAGPSSESRSRHDPHPPPPGPAGPGGPRHLGRPVPPRSDRPRRPDRRPSTESTTGPTGARNGRRPPECTKRWASRRGKRGVASPRSASS